MCPGRDEARPACHLRGSGALTEQGVVDAHLCCRTSCERHIPLFLQRPAAPPAGPKFELALADPMHELQARQGHGRRPVGLEPEHGLASALDSPVVLLDDVVQVTAPTHQDIFPPIVLATEPAQTRMTRPMPIQSYLARPSGCA